MIWPLFFLIVIYGACVGSFLNVVVYRMPRDLSLWHPGSHCPRCTHKLAWYDNLPIVGWLLLRGRCRYCALSINVQYPLVETITLALFGLLPAAYYLTDFRVSFHELGMAHTWPVLIVHLVLLAGLLAVTIIDARYYIIPLSITWFIALTAALVLPLAVWFKPEIFLVAESANQTYLRDPAIVPATSMRFWNAQIGALVGLVIANVLLLIGWLPRSFPFPSVEQSSSDTATDQPAIIAENTAPTATIAPASTTSSTPSTTPSSLPILSSSPNTTTASPMSLPPALVLIGAVMLVPALLGWLAGGWGMLTAMVLLWLAAMVIALRESATVSHDANTTQPSDIHGSPEIWLAHPHPRREVLKEVLFLLLPMVGAFLAHTFLPRGWMQDWQPQTPAPFVLGGVVMGYLVGGALVWGTRILGTLAFGKEAMGLGDVHLLACIGAVLGPIDAVIVFFLAPVLGLVCILVSVGVSRMVKGEVRAIPYGPYLALATVVLMIVRDQLGFLGL